MDLAVSAMYIRRQFINATIKENVLEMVQNIRNEQYNILLASDWIDNKTRLPMFFKIAITSFCYIYFII